jgi:protein subunit release factor A
MNQKTIWNKFKEEILKRNSSITIEIKPDSGDTNSILFADKMLKMYSNYAKNQGCEVEIKNQTGAYGSSNIVFSIYCKIGKLYNKIEDDFKYESGVHRVQCFPEKEGSGKIFTSRVEVTVFNRYQYRVSRKKQITMVEKMTPLEYEPIIFHRTG